MAVTFTSDTSHGFQRSVCAIIALYRNETFKRHIRELLFSSAERAKSFELYRIREKCDGILI